MVFIISHWYLCCLLSYLDPSGEICSLVLVVYKFDNVQNHAVLFHPHGNAKKNKTPYKRTKQSTINLLKTEIDHSSPKKATNKVFEEQGRTLDAKCAGGWSS